jgi:putative ABC transport system permease protein
MQSFRIAYRNVLRQAKRALLLGGAIAFGFFIFTLLNGFTGGLLDSVSKNFAELSGGHIYISGTEVSSLGSEISVIRDTQTAESALAALGDQVFSYNTRSSARASLIIGSKQETLQLEGVRFTQETDFIDSLTFAQGSAEDFLRSPDGILIPEKLLSKLGLEVGESVVVKTTTINGQQNVGDAVVVGSLKSQDLFAPGVSAIGYAHIEYLNKLLDMSSSQYQTLNIYLKDLAAIDTATTKVMTALARSASVKPREEQSFGPPNPAQFGFGGLSSVAENERWQGTKFAVTNLNDNLQGVDALVGVINYTGLVIFLVIIVIIMVGIMNSYRMVMLERTAEIGTMRAMGIHKAGIRNIFIYEALIVSFIGTLLGLILALIAMASIGLINFGIDSSFSLFLNQGQIQFNLSFLRVIGNILLICVMSVAAVYLPARTAARLQPAEALRAA